MTTTDSVPSPPALDLTAVSKRFGSVTALRDITFSVAQGEVHGLLGPNGAGKSTLLRLLFGLVRTDHGDVRTLGRDAHAGQHGVAGFVDMPSFYPYFTARKNLQLLGDYDGGHGREHVEEALATVGLADRSRHKVGTYSTGMRQRLGIAAALLRDPQLLILDEPTSGIDPSGVHEVHELIDHLAATGRTVLLSSHDMSEVERLCGSVTILNHGRLVYSGCLESLRQAAPAPSFNLRTADDAVAREVGDVIPGVQVDAAGEGLVVYAQSTELDAFVLTLAARGVAVRGLTRRDTALEALFLRLTAETEDDVEEDAA
ncbi:ABC transporter ATP-binding protein [Jatrophihabitans sp.]|uniref:ABC transporter ATP-binding protein n=1 Tax=Jatrophihabitans sp. TaxID=1932789 RepID=UPI0030C6D20F|nr:transporter related [Jatrophihabitans sp.]